MIGRDEELARLKDTVRRSVAERRTHLVTVVGAAGIGKSRLTWEFEKYLDGLPERYHWRKGRCFAYGQASYSAFAEAMKSDAGIRDDDTGEVADDKIHARISELGTEPAGPAVDALLALLGRAPVDVPRDELHEAWRRHVETIAERAPLVLVLEDIHWADEGLLDLTEFLARWSTAPLMILALARHELLERRPAWGGGIPNATLIVLDALAAHSSSIGS
jgi:predicted ATPase